MKRTTIAVIAVVLLAGLAGCTGSGPSDADPSAQDTESTNAGTIVYENPPEGEGVIRFVDREAGVVCYVFARGDGYDGQGGLSCVPLNDTALEGSDL